MDERLIVVEDLNRVPVGQQRVELVERKGKGHPDSICDAIAEEVSHALCQKYMEAFGRILHYNADKAMLIAGRTLPKLGGGDVMEPMRLVLGDRASSICDGKEIDVPGVVESAARNRLRQNLRFVDANRHLILQNEMKQGSPELTDIFERDLIVANDTSAAVGYAPLSETERLVLETEHWLNLPDFQQRFPEAGEDVKVMAVRRDRHLFLTVAIAFVDRFVPNTSSYFSRKEQMRQALTEYLLTKVQTIDQISVQLNTLDDPERGIGGMYLTVLGTSAEGGDCGQVGRGNRVNGVIPLNRPISNEAAAGKNPVSHVGKIYSLLTHHIANEVIQRVAGVSEVYIWLSSQIGQPINKPMLAASHVVLRSGVGLPDVEPSVKAILEQELAGIHEYSLRIINGEFAVW
jgi:S-adenosylmethionine synthetase